MAAVVLCARWYPGARFTAALSQVFALSNLGYLLAATPWAALVAWVGWRQGFVVAAVGTAIVAALFYALTWDPPPAEARARPERLVEVLRGLPRWRAC